MNLFSQLRLYVIPDRKIGAPRSLLYQAEAAINGGATAIQLRDKELSGKDLLHTANQMRKLCCERNVLFIVNDRIDIALASGAHGVHVGQSDIPPGVVRSLVGDGLIVGVSAKTEDQAKQAVAEGADYLGAGAVFPTSSKQDVRILGLDGLKRVVEATDLPVVAIGGVSEENISTVLKTGVCGAALISSVIGAPDIQKRTRNIREILDREYLHQ
jgi:thiamine-phosphate pyrophosphorylase